MMAARPREVEPLHAGDLDAVVSVLAEAFAGYPVMRFVLGSDTPHARPLRRLVELFVTARVMRAEPMLGIRDERGDLIAAAITSFPGRTAAPAEFADVRAAVWQELGADAEARYDAYGAATRPFAIDEPHLHLNMIGVLPGHQGTGLARRLVHAVESLSRADPVSTGVSLNTEDARNVALYRHLGYEVVGHAVVGPDLETWGFFRRSS